MAENRRTSAFNVKSVANPEEWKRRDAAFHKFVTNITESGAFNAGVMGVIFLNALVMAVETYGELKKNNVDFFFILDELFLAVYTVEFILKVYAEPKKYWKNGYNLFDFLVLALSISQSVMTIIGMGTSGLQALRVFRALRTLRTLRTVSFIRGLQVGFQTYNITSKFILNKT